MKLYFFRPRRVILSVVEIRVKRGSNDVFIVRDLGGKITKPHYRSRFAPSLGSGSTAKISHREIFSAQDDTNEDCLDK